MSDTYSTINRFLGADPIAGELALRDLVALGDPGEDALFGKPLPYPVLRQQQRRWLRYVATREQTVLNRLLAIVGGDPKDNSSHAAAFLLAGAPDTRRAQSGVYDLLSVGFDGNRRPTKVLSRDYHRYADIFEAWGFAGGAAGEIWHHVSQDSFVWEKLHTFAFRAACASFARLNTGDAWALEQLVTHELYDHRIVTISAGPDDLLPISAVDAGELWMQPYRIFGAWKRGEVADKVLDRWSTHEHWRIRAFGAEILAALAFSRVVGPVENWVRHEPVAEVRKTLLSALGNSKTPEGAEILLGFVEGREPEGYNAAAGALWRAENKERARRALLVLSEGQSFACQAEALVSLARLGQAHPRLPDFLGSHQPYVRLNAAIAYAHLGDQSVRPRLAKMQGETAGSMENIMLAAAVAMLGEPGSGQVLHQSLVSGAAAQYPDTVDLSDCKSSLQEAVLAGFAAGGSESEPFLRAWQAELAPLDPIPLPVAHANALFTSSATRATKTRALLKKPLKLFLSYSHRDERMRERLGQHLGALETQGLIQIWHDREIEPADDWEREISREIQEADVVLLLVSASFISSKYCQRELRDALELRSKQKSLAIPIILRPCDWESVFNLPNYKTQALPRDNKPVASNTWLNQDAAFASIVGELRGLFERMTTSSS